MNPFNHPHGMYDDRFWALAVYAAIAVSMKFTPRSRALLMTLVAISGDGRVSGIPLIPTLETSRSVLPNLMVLISHHDSRWKLFADLEPAPFCL